MEKLWGIICNIIGEEFNENELFSISGKIKEEIDLIDDLGYDSLSLMSLILEIEEKFEIEIDEEYINIQNIRNITTLKRIIENNGELKNYEQE